MFSDNKGACQRRSRAPWQNDPCDVVLYVCVYVCVDVCVCVYQRRQRQHDSVSYEAAGPKGGQTELRTVSDAVCSLQPPHLGHPDNSAQFAPNLFSPYKLRVEQDVNLNFLALLKLKT